jgi:hypothetical protein
LCELRSDAKQPGEVRRCRMQPDSHHRLLALRRS